jgi:hypothetical protein
MPCRFVGRYPFWMHILPLIFSPKDGDSMILHSVNFLCRSPHGVATQKTSIDIQSGNLCTNYTKNNVHIFSDRIKLNNFDTFR